MVIVLNLVKSQNYTEEDVALKAEGIIQFIVNVNKTQNKNVEKLHVINMHNIYLDLKRHKLLQILEEFLLQQTKLKLLRITDAALTEIQGKTANNYFFHTALTLLCV